MNWYLAVTLLVIFIIFAVIHKLSKNKKPLRRAFLSMLTGALLLTVIDVTSSLTGMYIPISLVSVITSIAGGVPGVTLLLFVNLLI